MMVPGLQRLLSGTLRRQLVFSVAAIHAVMMTLFVVDLTIRQQRLIHDRQVEHATALSNALAVSSAGWLSAQDVAGLQELVRAQQRYPELRFAMIVDHHGCVLAHTDPARVGQYLGDLPDRPVEAELGDGRSLVDIVVPAMIEGRHVGWARVGLGQQVANGRLAEITRDGLLYALGAILVGSLLAWLMGRRITRRLDTIQRVMDEVGTGNLKPRVALSGGDEAARLAEGFNGMVGNLESQAEERNRAERSLRESHEFLDALIESIPMMVFVKDADHLQFFKFNKAGERMLGFSRDQLVGKHVSELFPAEQATAFDEDDRRVLSSRQALDIPEEQVQTKDGGLITIHTIKVPLLDHTGTPRYLLGISEDITARKQADQNLQALKDELQSTLNALPDLLFEIGLDGTFHSYKTSRTDLLAMPPEAFLGRRAADILPPEVASEMDAGIQEAHRDGYSSGRQYELAIGSEPRWFELSIARKQGCYPDGPRFILIAHDISIRKRAKEALRVSEAQIQHLQRMESIGRLAGGVAHDMNNVLAAIVSVAELMQRGHGDPRTHADKILQASLRGRNLVKGLLDFARKDLQNRIPLDLNDLVRQEAELLSSTTLQRIHIELELAPELPKVLGEPSALSNVLMNLCVNALDAMPGGGTLRFRTRLDPANRVLVSVEDTGVGMPPEVAARAVEPYFTTKNPGKGTGLGLSVVFGTVQAHGGTIEIHSTPGTGTRVDIRLPAVAVEAASESTAGSGEDGQGARNLEILLVDDDMLMRDTLPSLLGLAGHRVSVASSGREALQRLDQGLRPDAILLDLNMPEMDGLETLSRLRVGHPEVPVLLSSGYVDEAVRTKVERVPRTSLLSKPYSMAEFQRALEKLLRT